MNIRDRWLYVGLLGMGFVIAFFAQKIDHLPLLEAFMWALVHGAMLILISEVWRVYRRVRSNKNKS